MQVVINTNAKSYELFAEKPEKIMTEMDLIQVLISYTGSLVS